MNDTVNLVLRTTTIDKILELLDRKIEKVEKRKLMKQWLNILKNLKILNQK